jgi:exo-beta-1,3-glucanase (GH17 family)
MRYIFLLLFQKFSLYLLLCSLEHLLKGLYVYRFCFINVRFFTIQTNNMKTNVFQKQAFITIALLLSAFVSNVQAAGEPEIVINYIPPIGADGIAEGRVVWSELTAGNAGEYAVIAMLHASWGDDYVKPAYDNYLSAVASSGYFSINITTPGSNDKAIDDVYFYFVRRETFNDIDGNTVKSGTMTGKYFGQPLKVNRTAFWENRLREPVSNILPGFVGADESITLTCNAGETIRYTLDGSDPKTSSTAETYTASTSLKTPSSGSLLVKAVCEKSGMYSSVASLLWMPETIVHRDFWGLNVSLALNGEYFGYPLSEETTRERLNPLKNLTHWIRTYGTLNNGHPYINKIAKTEFGQKTMIGVYVTADASENEAQIQGLRQILEMGPAPDLITVGNECSLMSDVTAETLITCIDVVRELVKSKSLAIPIGTVDIAGATLNHTTLEKLDFIGVDIYNGTWDATPESQMFTAMKQSYAAEIAKYQPKMVLLTETGTPYAGGSYVVNGVTQTPSIEKANNYLSSVLKWVHAGNVPVFYFEAYDEPIKAQESGNNIEQYFGVLGNDFQPHPFYKETMEGLSNYSLPNTKNANPRPNPVKNFFIIDGLPNGATVGIFDMSGKKVKERKNSPNGIDVSDLPDGVYGVKAGEATYKIIKKR